MWLNMRGSTPIVNRLVESSYSAQFYDLQPVGLGAVLDRFLAAHERLGDGAQRHAFAGELVELLDPLLPPRLRVPLEPFRHVASPHSAGLIAQPSEAA